MSFLRKSLSKFKPRHIIPLTAVGGITIAVLTFGGNPLLDTTDDFILFAQEEVKLEQGVQVSSGDVGSNNKLTINKEALITGDLFADSITLDKDTVINGNATFNTLTTKKETQILGEQTDSTSLPIANLPEIQSITVGTEDLTFSGDDNVLPQGSYRNITLNKDSTLTLTGDTYNIARLDLKEGATLLYATTTTLNIEQELKGQQNVSILNTGSTTPNDLTINYIGRPNKGTSLPAASIKANENADTKGKSDENNDKGKSNEEHGKKDENGVTEPTPDTQNENIPQNKNNQPSQPIHFGNNSFLNFILIAPNATVNIGERSTVRGQILADKIMVGKGSILSRSTTFAKESTPEEVITTPEGAPIINNEIIINLADGTTEQDAQEFADLINGRIVGVNSFIDEYQIEVNTTTLEELDTLIMLLKELNDPRIEAVGHSTAAIVPL